MLNKGAIVEIQHIKGEFLSNLTHVNKKDEVNRPKINLKNLNELLPYKHLKTEGLHCLRNVLKKWDCMCKLDLKDSYSSITLNPSSRTFVQFPWWGKLYEFLRLGFGLGPAPKFFTKLMKITVAVLRLINILIIVYLDEMLLIDRTLQEPQMSRDTLIFLFKELLFSM